MFVAQSICGGLKKQTGRVLLRSGVLATTSGSPRRVDLSLAKGLASKVSRLYESRRE